MLLYSIKRQVEAEKLPLGRRGNAYLQSHALYSCILHPQDTLRIPSGFFCKVTQLLDGLNDQIFNLFNKVTDLSDSVHFPCS